MSVNNKNLITSSDALPTSVAITHADLKKIQAQGENEVFMEQLQSDTFNTTLTSLSDFIYTFDTKGNFSYANKPLLDLLGLTLQQVIGKNFHQLPYPKDLATRLQAQIKEVTETKKIIKDDTVFINPAGKIGYYEYIFNPILAHDGSIHAVAGSTRDITKRKEAEDALSQSKERYKLMVEGVKDYIIYTMDTKGNITNWNQAAEDITGWKKEEVMGKYHGFIYVNEDRLKKIPAKELHIASDHGKAVTEHWQVKKDGSSFWGSGIVNPLWDSQNILKGYSIIMRDITERKELEQRKDEFISIASHEFKTPITSMKAYGQIMKKRMEKYADSQDLHFLEKMDNQMDKLVVLIEDLLNVSKIQSGKLDFNAEKIDIQELLTTIIDDIQHTTQTHTIELHGKMRKRIYADPNRLGQVMSNLLNNAIKYSPQAKKIVVHVVEDSTTATVSIQDFGIGIPKSKQGHIFDRYYRVDEHGKNKVSGLGLGLYISAEIIKQHGGRIWVDSATGKGSTFYFSLPVKNR